MYEPNMVTNVLLLGGLVVIFSGALILVPLWRTSYYLGRIERMMRDEAKHDSP